MKKQNRIVSLNMLSSLLLTSISIITSPLFSRLLGTSGYGIMSSYTVWMNAMAIVATLQTDATLVYARVTYAKEEQHAYQSAVMTLSLAFFSFLCVLIALLIRPISLLLKLSNGLIALLMLQSFGSFAVRFLNTRLQYEYKAGRNLFLSVGIVLVSLTLSLILVLSMPQEQRYIGRILGNVAVYGVLGIFAAVFVLLKGKSYFRPEYWKFCLGLVFPLIFMNLSNLVLGHSDLVMVRDALGDSASGIYGLAYTFSGVMFSIFTALNKSWVPFFFDDMKAGEREKVLGQSHNYLELYTILSMGFVLLTREVFHVFADKTYWDGTVLIPVFVASYYMNFLCTFPVNFEHFHLKVHAVSVITVLSALVNIGLNWMLIRFMGMAGAVIATLAAHCLQFAAHHLYCRLTLKDRDYPFGVKMLSGYFLAFTAALIIAMLLPGMWYIRWGVGAALGIWELLRIRKRKVLI